MWTLADQAVSSIINFALSYSVLRSVSLGDFGAFTVVFSCYVMALGVTQSLVCEPLMVRHSLDDREGWHAAVRAATGAALAIGFVGAIGFGCAGLVFAGSLGRAFGVLAAGLPLLLTQAVWRAGFFAAGRFAHAFWNDLAWGVGVLALLGVGLGLGWVRLELLLGVWAGCGGIAAVLGGFQSRTVPDVRRGWGFVAKHGDLGTRFVSEYGLGAGAAQASVILIGGISGLSAVGGMNGARVLLGPMNLLLAGSLSFGMPEGVRLRARSPERLSPTITAVGVALAAGAIALGAGLLALPPAVGRWIIPENWEQVRSYIVPVTLVVAGSGWKVASYLGLRILGAARTSLQAQLLASPLVVAGAAVGAVLGGGMGAAWGLAAAGWLGAWVYWHFFGRAVDRADAQSDCGEPGAP